MTPERIKELAEEAATCIETTDMDYGEMLEYLHGFLDEVIDEAVTGGAQARPTKATRRKRGRRT